MNDNDRQTLRKLAGEVRRIADLPEMQQRKDRWKRHNALNGDRPMVLCFPEGAWRELLPDDVLTCQDATARDWEHGLRHRIYWWQHIRDDAAIEPWFNVAWQVTIGDYGVDIPITRATERGSFIWDPPIKDLDRDLDKLHFRELSVDREATQRELDLAEEVFGDLLPPRIRGQFWWSMGLTGTAIMFVGLEQLMLYMHDQPDGLRRLMAFLRDDHLNLIQWCHAQGLLSLNNEAEGVGSGGIGCTDELPRAGAEPNQPVRPRDLWCLGESQETVGVSPAMFDEFVLTYQAPLLERFGLICYGCCEQMEQRMDYLAKRVPNVRRVSVSPFSDQHAAAEALAGRYIYSRKPRPTLVGAGFDEQEIREDMRRTLDVAGEQTLEFVLKDTHTVQNEPQRITDWTRIALEEVDRYIGS